MLERDEIRIVAEDLQYLGAWGSEISDAEVRRGSSVLRRLLVEDVYGQAWRAIGKPKQPKLIAVDVSSLLDPGKIGEVVYAIAAGAHFRGVQLACMLFNRGDKPIGAFGPPLRADGYPGEREYSLSEFLNSPSGIVERHSFSRREVIKFIANVRGGIHLGEKERKAERKLVARLSKIEKKLAVHTTDGLLVNVAIGQAIGTSPDAHVLIRCADEI